MTMAKMKNIVILISSMLIVTTEVYAGLEIDTQIKKKPLPKSQITKKEDEVLLEINTAQKPLPQGLLLPIASSTDTPDQVKKETIVLPVEVVTHWKIAKGETISHALRTWCEQNKLYKLYWESPELVSGVDIDLQDSFEGAVTTVIDALNRSVETNGKPDQDNEQIQNKRKLDAKFYRSNSPKILRIMVK